MCGIAASLDLGARARAEPWALPLMRHRGPDGEGVLVDPERGLVLEHCRLAIIDPTNPDADQPFSDPSGRWTIVYNGEIFNFRQLRVELEARGAVFRTNSDTEVVLEGFIRDGTRFLERLRGMFAFVIWDRETEELFAARDQIGVKPLYYALADGLLVIGSELRTVIGHPAVRRTLDPAGVVEYLAFGYTAGERTLIEGVRKLPPGHMLHVRDGNIEMREYWDVLPPEPPPDPAYLERELAELLDESVAAALVSDVPVGLMLSGGLDSSTIAALATRHVDPRDLVAYSIAFGLPDDEAAAAARLAADLGVRHRTIELSEQTLEAGFDEWLEGIDVPSANPTWVAVSAIARGARDDGIKVLLSGDGGDELFGGYNRWMRYLRFHKRYWSPTPRGVRLLAGRTARPLLHGLAGDIARRAGEGGDLFVGSRPFHDDDLARLLGPAGKEEARAFPPEAPVQELRERFDQRFPGGDYLAWMSYVALKRDLVEDYLGRLDKMAMRESVEGRVPLLDPSLARWAFRMPQEWKVTGFEQKALFRRTVRPLLPEYIVRRPKQGFCPPVAAWATSLLATRVESPGALTEQGLVIPDALARLHADGSVGSSFALWTLGTLAVWCERNL